MTGDIVKYISPSSFYYWEKCPAKAVYSKKYKDEQFFPKHPDAYLGTVVHKIYEKRFEWNFGSEEKFEKIWKRQIHQINEEFKDNPLQRRFYPVQWNANFYAVKKILLKNNILNVVKSSNKRLNFNVEKWVTDNNNIVGGYIDLQIKDNDNRVIEIIDFKTGNIYEKVNGKFQIKEAYKMQFALYAFILNEQQGFMPTLTLGTMNAKKVSLELDKEYIENMYLRAGFLKNIIKETDDIRLLTVANKGNCKFCNYRKICHKYQTKMINSKLDNNMIDIKGRITLFIKSKNMNNIEVITTSGKYLIKNLSFSEDLEINKEIYIYNLYFPDEKGKILYVLLNTIVEYVEN